MMFWKVFLISLFSALITGCGKESSVAHLDFSKTEKVNLIDESNALSIKYAIGSSILPHDRISLYKELFNYVGGKLGIGFKYVHVTSDDEVSHMMGSSDIDIALMCPCCYAVAHDKIGAKPLVVPEMFGRTEYRTYIIVSNKSHIRDIDGLSGRSFAYVEPSSSAGALIPNYILLKKGLNPGSFFSKTIYSYAHDKSVQAVIYGFVDAAAVSSIVWEYMNIYQREMVKKTRIIAESEFYPIPPIVDRPNLDPDLEAKIKDVFISMENDIRGRQILDKMLIDKFVPADDLMYDSVREINSFVDKNRKVE